VTTATLSTLTFGGILRSELIKIRTLRSTIWCYAVLVVLNVAIGALAALVISLGDQADASPATAVGIASSGILVSQAVVIVLGALVITGEYGTGMIRTTFTIDPRRLGAFFGKALVLAIFTAVLGGVSVILTGLVTAPILASGGAPVDFADGKYWVAVLGAAGNLALIALLAYAIGAIIRNSAGGIATALGVTLVLPNLLLVFTALTGSIVPLNIRALLPSEAGASMRSYATGAVSSGDQIVLDPFQGGLVLLAWVVVPMIVAAVLVKRRDV
jgi:ABC-2 type transport system permease protein